MSDVLASSADSVQSTAEVLNNFLIKPDWYDLSFNFDALHSTGSDRLVITFGDSWTWGGSLRPECRKQNIFGRRIADALAADFMNASLPSMSNTWIVKHFNKFCSFVDTLHYKDIYAIVTLTEVGREINASEDLDVDYVKLFEHDVNVYDAIKSLSKNKLDILLAKIPKNVKLILGRNYINDSYDERAKHFMLPDSWLDVLTKKQQLYGYNNQCYALKGSTINKFKQIAEFVNITPTRLKTDILKLMDSADEVLDVLDASKYNIQSAGFKHPTVEGHAIWADYILTHIKQEYTNGSNT